MVKKAAEKPESDDEKQRLKEQMKDAADRWNSITDKSRVRRTKLDKIKEPAQVFAEKEKAFVDWLKKAEKRAKVLDTVPDEPETAHENEKANEVYLIAFHF